jgi:mevalonate kinase
MPAISASAPGKIILFGEHAVVYSQPAIAAPVLQVRAKAILTPNPRGKPGSVSIQAPGIGLEAELEALPERHPLRAAIDATLRLLNITHIPACNIRITSTIPVAAGLGSGAAVSVALARGLSGFLGVPLPDESVSAIAYEVEKIHHGNPSGIDNTVITSGMPVLFVREQPIEQLRVPQPFIIVIGDTGVRSPTAIAVGDVRRHWEADPAGYEAIFQSIGEITRSARVAIEQGKPEELGELMAANHAFLQQIGVSSPQLDGLVIAALNAGAMGAKLSGGGRGGNMIALPPPGLEDKVAQALQDAGATRTIITEVKQRST